jgi:hypothetical protein
VIEFLFHHGYREGLIGVLKRRRHYLGISRGFVNVLMNRKGGKSMADLNLDVPLHPGAPWPGKELPPEFRALEKPNSPPAPVQEQTKTVGEPVQKSAEERVPIIQQFAELVRSVTPIAFAGMVLVMWYHSPQPAPVVVQAPSPAAPAPAAAPTPIATEELMRAFAAGYQAAQSNANTAAATVAGRSLTIDGVATDAPRKKPISLNHPRRYWGDPESQRVKQLNQQVMTPQ